MNTINDTRILILAAVLKLLDGEPMSLMDGHRIMDLLEKYPFQIYGASPDESAGLIGRMNQIAQRYSQTKQ